MSSPRVLIDTNTLLSGLIWNGNEAHLLELCITGKLHLLIPEFVLNEARRVIALKFPKHTHLLNEALALLDHEVLGVPTDESLHRAREVVRDPNDAAVLACILDSQPDHAVTGDKDLLTDAVRALFPTSRCSECLEHLQPKHR